MARGTTYRSKAYIECFERRRTLITIFANILPQVWGLKLMSLVSFFLYAVGLDEDPSFIILTMGIFAGALRNRLAVDFQSL